MEFDARDTAVVITDPQNDFLSPDGVTWGLVGESVTENRTVEHIDELVAAAKRAEKALVLEIPTVQRLGEIWFARYIQPRYKHPDVVARVLRKHINPVLGSVAPPDVYLSTL